MAFLKIEVDPTTVTYEDWFTYIISVSFGGLIGPIDPAFITFTVPENLEFQKPFAPEAESITQNGRQFTIDYGTIEDTGITTTIEFKCRFEQEALNGSSVTLTANFYQNDPNTPYFTETSEPVTLQIDPQYTLSFNGVLPPNRTVAPNGAVIYEMILENIGDQWPDASEFVINVDFDNTEFLTLDETFLFPSEDISNNRYTDESGNEITIVPYEDGNGFTFTVSSYRGQKLHFYVKAQVSDDAPIGTEITQEANWTINDVMQTAATSTVSVSEPIYSASSTMSGPTKVQPGNYVRYSNATSNTGNQDLNDVVVELQVPFESISLDTLTTGTYEVSPIEFDLTERYSITYETSDGTTYTLDNPNSEDGLFDMATSVQLSLADLIPADRDVSAIRMNLGAFPVGATTVSLPVLRGYAKEELEMDTKFSFPSIVSWTNGEGETEQSRSSFTTEVSQLSELFFQNHRFTPSSDLIPGEVVRIRSVINGRYSQLNNPIYMNLLSDKFTFNQTGEDLIDSFYLQYYNGETRETINSVDNADIFPFPKAELIPSYNKENDTLIRLSPPDGGISLPQDSFYTIQYNATVAVGAIGDEENVAILGNVGPNGSVTYARNIYNETDTIDLDGDGVFNERLAMSNRAKLSIMEHWSLFAQKESKGESDTEYVNAPDYSTGIAGNTVDYRITATNTGNRPLNQIELVDILPHIGDTSVLYNTTPRESSYPVYLVTPLDVTLTDQNGEPVVPSPEFLIQYSKSYDPVRFDYSGAEIGTVDDWTTNRPDPITEVRSFKIETQNQDILPGETLTIHFVAIVPPGVSADELAWNSFAITATYTDSDNTEHSLLPVEPEKAGIQVRQVAGTSNINGFTFLDANKDGIYDDGDEGINDVGIILYRVEGTTATAVDTTITVPNVDGRDGFYNFAVTDPGRYLLRFAPNPYDYQFTTQNLTVPLGSRTNQSNGFTTVFTVEEGTDTAPILSGLVPFSQVDFVLNVNKQVERTVRSSIHSQILLELKLTDTIDFIN